ncbi:hypothetical protein PM082_003676 [Marasmius tenuissimus]|nr:hypothetical protein PM082_003676 [Marasmius tenuissimus]
MVKDTRRGMSVDRQGFLAILGSTPSLEILDISFSSLPQDVIVHHFGKCPLLHTIIIDQGCASDMIKSPSRSLPTSSSPTYQPSGDESQGEVEKRVDEQEIQLVDQPMVYPALTTIYVSRAVFSGNLLDLLIDSLQFRSGRGFPIKDVSLKECKHLSEDAVLRLKANVDASVEWDSYTACSYEVHHRELDGFYAGHFYDSESELTYLSDESDVSL